uniref:Uncharacterized protein n=2 Tax=Setaria viridis TaxID=4556 RepID=A0A4U6TX72_SETVI|nr:hypothetical protein SEVIR_7G311200v2 [Setaria viridis]
MTLTRCFDHVLERREYVLNAFGDLKLVHYGKSTSPERMDRAAAVMQARLLVADIRAYRNSSDDKREEILRQIKDQSSGSGGGSLIA